MSGNKSNKWKKVGGRSRSANYNAVRIPQQTANIFNISDLMGKASTDNSTLGKINIHDNVAIQGTLDVSGSATGVTSTKTSGNEFATLDWVNGELNPTALWTLHQNGNIIYNKNGTQVDIIGNTYNEGTSTFNGSLQVLSSFPLESSFFGLKNDTDDQSQSSNFGSSVAISNMNDSSYNIAVTSINHAEVYYTNSLGNAGTLGAKIDKNNDINFNNAIMGFNGSNQSIAISADGKIVIVGDSVHNCVYISMTNSDGSVKTVTITGEPIGKFPYNNSSHFGYSVAISSDGMWFVVGAPNYEFETDSGYGKAYVFKLTNTEANTLNINDISNVSVKGGFDMQLGNSVAIDASGNIITIGSEFVETNYATHKSTKRGMMNIYKFVSNSQSSSSERDTLIEIGTSTRDIYQGYTLSEKYANSLSISADGTVLAVGAPGTSGENGSVYVYQIDGITASQIADVNYQSVSYVRWKLVKKILGKTGSSFGTSVSLNLAGNTLVAGGPTYVGSANGQGTGQGTGQGYVEVYAYVHSDWRLACPTIYQEFPNNLTLTYVPNTVAMFGSSVSISSNDGSNNMIVVGAPNNNLVSNTNGINNSNTDIGRGTIFTYTLNDIRSSIFTVDSGNNTSSFKGPVYIDRNGITVDPSDNEVVTAGWVKTKYGAGTSTSGLKYAEDDTVIQNLSSQLTNAQQLISQQGLTIDTMKSSLTASYDKNTIDKLAKKIDITQQMINHHAQNVTNIKLNATSKMAIDELTRKLNDVQVVIDKQNEDIFRMSLQTRSNEEYIHKQNEDIYRMSLQTRSNEEFIFNYDMKYNDTMKQQSNLINDSQMRIRSQEKQVKGLCRNVNTHSTNIQSMKQMIMSVGGGVGSGTEPTIPK